MFKIGYFYVHFTFSGFFRVRFFIFISNAADLSQNRKKTFTTILYVAKKIIRQWLTRHVIFFSSECWV